MNEKKKTEKLESFATVMTAREVVEMMPEKLDKSLEGAEAFNQKVNAVETAFEKHRKPYLELGLWNEARAAMEKTHRDSSAALRDAATLAKTPLVDHFAKTNEDAASRRTREQDYLKALAIFRQQCQLLDAQRDRLLEVPATGRAAALLSADKLRVPGLSPAGVMHNKACKALVIEAYGLLKHGLRIAKDRGEVFRQDQTDYNQRAMNRAMNANEIKAGEIWPKYLKLESQKRRLAASPMVSRPGKGGAR
jgi:hypothetical protein